VLESSFSIFLFTIKQKTSSCIAKFKAAFTFPFNGHVLIVDKLRQFGLSITKVLGFSLTSQVYQELNLMRIEELISGSK